ncbi:hypothetical protein [Puniceibacterium sp. IMCC21224]|uniref:hypothetical protein n=1 Tax=Puniceibacterium sp. IMCC21224 TaxID=1618204 RepID=UPI00064DE545|nr:hypothetical protein [Puniceibacterium sp. IMCC21224]KMK67575.1 hypothetical protein IMCC21224_112446 [Puniceibacterium sp. IMCC21224]
MTQTFTAASDEEIIDLIQFAEQRLVVAAPAFSLAVAEALAERMSDLPKLAMTIILDADPEVYRMGYGEVAALESIRAAAAKESFRLQEQAGIRIGLVISDDSTLVYAPISSNIEAGSTSSDKPNGIYLDGAVTEMLAEKSAGIDVQGQPVKAEIGNESLSAARVAATQQDLKDTPPLPVDLTRKLNVFITRVQYVELKAKGYQISRRRAELPKEFFGMDSDDLKERITGRIGTPLDGIGKLDVEITIGEKTEKLSVDEKFLQKERDEIQKALTHVMAKRGRIILRKDRASFDLQIERFKAIIAAYQEALGSRLEEAREQFRESFIAEFLERWKANPPARFGRRIGGTTEEELRAGIIVEADILFNRIVKLDGPDVSVIYKDIAIEDLKDESFMTALRDVMTKGGMKKEDLIKLFEQGEAAASQHSFNLEGAST